MGETPILLSTIFQEIGIETVVPPPITQETIAIGAKHAPELACFPFKVCLGSYIQAVRSGADTILMAGGCGPCRFGVYAEVQRSIMRSLGYDVDFVILEPPASEGPRFWRELHRFLGWKRLLRLPSATYLAWRKLLFLDTLGDCSRILLPREVHPGSMEKLIQSYRRKLEFLSTVGEIRILSVRLLEELAAFPLDREKPLLRFKVGGEIYMVLEPAVNYRTESVLASLGVEVHRAISISHWVRENLLSFLYQRKISHELAPAKPYLRCFVGGHAQITVADAVKAGMNRMDGMVQIMPFTCMPELVAQSILPEIGRDFELPVLTLVLDEQSGEAGVQTRLEAFVDLARRRRSLEAGA